MSKTYNIGDHTFTQREDGLYMCDNEFEMTREECEEWMYDQTQGMTLFSLIRNDVYIPVAVAIHSEVSDEVCRSYVTEVDDGTVAKFTSCDLPKNYLGGLFDVD